MADALTEDGEGLPQTVGGWREDAVVPELMSGGGDFLAAVVVVDLGDEVISMEPDALQVVGHSEVQHALDSDAHRVKRSWPHSTGGHPGVVHQVPVRLGCGSSFWSAEVDHREVGAPAPRAPTSECVAVRRGVAIENALHRDGEDGSDSLGSGPLHHLPPRSTGEVFNGSEHYLELTLLQQVQRPPSTETPLAGV